jgi:hypothetical protein
MTSSSSIEDVPACAYFDTTNCPVHSPDAAVPDVRLNFGVAP